VFTSDIILKVNTTAFSHSFCSFLWLRTKTFLV
jgi:hypothetical protein